MEAQAGRSSRTPARRPHEHQPRAGPSNSSPSQDASDDTSEENEQPETKKIFVTGFSHQTRVEDLTEVMERFGRVTIEKFSLRLLYAVMHFETDREAEEALKANKKVEIFGDYLHIRPYYMNNKQNSKRDFSRSKQKNVIIEPKNIDLNGEFDEQVDRILAAIRLSQEEATRICMLYADVERVLQSQWPGCVAMPFGSITTGLGIKTSDADCYVHLPVRMQNIPGAGAALVNRAKRVLQSHPRIFTEILSIPRANTPIVKFYHLPTATNCDLSFKTPLGVKNSRLIEFLLKYDPQIIPFALIVKYWVKVHGLSGTGRLTNYALSLLLIFYLQQPPLSILPPVKSLQRNPTEDDIVDFWNTGFVEKRNVSVPSNSNLPPLPELLGGFFEFYSQFDFDELVVCPYVGRPVKKEEFEDLNLLPECFERYKDNVTSGRVLPIRVKTPIVVQDPFEQCHNVACAISPKLASEIRVFMKYASKHYEEEKSNGCRDLLKNILLQRPRIVRTSAHPEFRFNLFPKVIQSIIDDDWKSVVRTLLVQMFEDMLKIKLTKLEGKSNELKEREKYSGTVTKAVWKREKFTKVYSMINLGFAEKQAKITEEILNVEKEKLNLNFNLTLTFVYEPKCASVWMKMVRGDAPLFTEFGKLFITSMHTWFTTLLKPHLQEMPVDPVSKLADTIEMIDSNSDINNVNNNNLDSDDDDDDVQSTNDNVDSANTTGSSEQPNEPAEHDNDVGTTTVAKIQEAAINSGLGN